MRALVALGLLLGFTPGGVAYGIDAGVAAVQYDFPNQASCYPSALAEACPLSYDQGQDPGLGDDTLYQYRGFTTLKAELRPDALGLPVAWPTGDVRVTQEYVTFPSTLPRDLADLVADLDGAIPAPLHEHVRARWHGSGVILTLRSPDPANLTEGRVTPYDNEFGVPLLPTNGTHVRVPLGTQPQETDDVWWTAELVLTECVFPYQTWGRGVCLGLPAQGALGVVNGSLPNLVASAWLYDTAVIVGGGLEPWPPAVPLEASLAGESALELEGAWSFPRGEEALPAGHTDDLIVALPGDAPASRSTAPASPEVAAASTGSGAPPLPWAEVLVGSAVILLAAALLTRLRREHLLRHWGRARLVEYVRSHPGCSMQEAASDMGVEFKTAQYHARVLARFGLLEVEKRGHVLRLFPTGTYSSREKNAWVALRTGSSLRLLSALCVAPGSSLSQLALNARLSKAGASRRVDSLEAAGALVREANGARAVLHPTELGRALVAQLAPLCEGPGDAAGAGPKSSSQPGSPSEDADPALGAP